MCFWFCLCLVYFVLNILCYPLVIICVYAHFNKNKILYFVFAELALQPMCLFDLFTCMFIQLQDVCVSSQNSLQVQLLGKHNCHSIFLPQGANIHRIVSLPNLEG